MPARRKIAQQFVGLGVSQRAGNLALVSAAPCSFRAAGLGPDRHCNILSLELLTPQSAAEAASVG
jgi:hypothetical protein